MRDPRHAYRLRSTLPGGLTDREHAFADATRQLPADAGWIDEETFHRSLYSSLRDAKAVRFRLRKLVRRGLIDEVEFPSKGIVEAYSLTEAGTRRLRDRANAEAPLGREFLPRNDQAIHHLLCVQAALAVVRVAGATAVTLQGDESLRSSARRGQRSTAKVHSGHLPDGLLKLRLPDGAEKEVAIEIITSKYSDDVIQSKYRELDKSTFYFATSEALADRMEALTGRRPHLI